MDSEKKESSQLVGALVLILIFAIGGAFGSCSTALIIDSKDRCECRCSP